MIITFLSRRDSFVVLNIFPILPLRLLMPNPTGSITLTVAVMAVDLTVQTRVMLLQTPCLKKVTADPIFLGRNFSVTFPSASSKRARKG